MTKRNTAVALGLFDGVHRGHRAVLSRTVELAKASGLTPCAFTFTMNGGGPDAKADVGAIITPQARAEEIRASGIAEVFCPDFKEFCGLSGEEFVGQLLVGSYGARVVCCGADFRFGRGARWSVEDLAGLCALSKAQLHVVPPVLEGGAPVSSTRIRALISEGAMKEAANLLGRPYSFCFPVAHGSQLGRTLNFPTMNQPFPQQLVLPRFGVYAAFAQVDGQWRAAVTNVGVKPTVANAAAPLAETFVLGEAGDWYGQSVPVRLVAFLRPEQKFASTQELRAAIAQDCEHAAHACRAAQWGAQKTK